MNKNARYLILGTEKPHYVFVPKSITDEDVDKVLAAYAVYDAVPQVSFEIGPTIGLERFISVAELIGVEKIYYGSKQIALSKRLKNALRIPDQLLAEVYHSETGFNPPIWYIRVPNLGLGPMTFTRIGEWYRSKEEALRYCTRHDWVVVNP